MARVDSEREQFEDDMAAHIAALMDYAKPYVGRLSNGDRDYFIRTALEFAWDRHKQFNPEKTSLLRWWEECLHSAALTRKTWTLRYSHAMKTVRGKHLGRRT